MSKTDFDPFASATQLASAIREGALSAQDALEGYLDRVDRFNPDLNAIIFSDRDGARRRARMLDEMAGRDDCQGPLHGVPMTIKESFDIAGMPTTWGVPALKDNVAKTNALAVDRLQAAGAVIFGKTNVPLLLADWQSFNEIYGVTNNPWDLSRSPGGSSGGSTAALAAGLSGIDAGSDIGASIRNPAHYCGVFGHKPSYGICPPLGQALPGILTPADISVIGPLARSATDLAITLDVMAGPAPQESVGYRLDLPPPGKTEFAEFKVAVMLSDSNSEVDAELTDTLQALIEKIAAAGATLDDAARPDIDTERAHALYVSLLRAATSSRLSEEERDRMAAEAAMLDPGDSSYHAQMLRANTMRHGEWLKLNNEREHMRRRWADFFEDYDLLLCPAAASAACPHDHAGERHTRTITVNGKQVPTTDQLFWAGFSGSVYLPSTVAPAGLTKSGLPVGLQIVGPYLQDRRCIEFAGLIEQAFGGFVAPPGYGG